MKCPKCGSSNPDAAENCSNCGVRFRRMVTVKRHIVLRNAKLMRRMTLTRLVLIPLGVSVSAAVAALLVAVLFFSPWISPLATVHDADGDGYPDAYDVAPRNPEFWAEGEALIVVMVHSEHTFSKYNYTLLVNGAPRAYGEIAAGQSNVENLEVSFPIGVTDQTQVVLGLTATDGSAAQRQLILENGGGYEANFTIPYTLPG